VKHWVVMSAQIGSRQVWAWGLVGAGPYFEEVNFTDRDGFTPADLDQLPVLSEHLFTVPVAEVEPSAPSFRQAPAPSVDQRRVES
jgi:hypothetical protein